MTRSERCKDNNTRWDGKQCIYCNVKAGHGITSHCGYDDNLSRHDVPFKPCQNGTFNDGSSFYCQPCSLCPGRNVVTFCSTTSNTVCGDPRSSTTTVPVPEPTTSQPASSSVSSLTMTYTYQGSTLTPSALPVTNTDHLGVLWAIPFVILVSIMLAALCAYIVNTKRKRGQHSTMAYNRRPSYFNPGFSPLPTSARNSDMEDILNVNILSAPLQTVLDNLDVLEELVILLDPESHGIKNTKHLASLCSFPSTWITYTYSMKDIKSPLKAVLEGTTSRNPDWTVGHLAKLLKQMERNDAIIALAKLRVNEKDM